MSNTIRMCTRCRARPTFTDPPLCFACRNVKAKPTKPSEVER